MRKGDLLVVIGRDRIRADYQAKADALKNAQSDLARARRDVRLQKTLFRKQAVAYSSVEDAERAQVHAVQTLRGAEENFKLAVAQWNGSNVYSSFDGTVVKDSIGDDKFVSGNKEMVTVADVSEFSVRARVDELDIRQVREGQWAEVLLSIFPLTPFKARVTALGSAPESAGIPEVPVVLKLASTQGMMLRPRLTADVRIMTGMTDPVISVPLTAIANSDGQPRVWRIGWLGRIHRQSVELGRTNPDRVEVKSGIRMGERICSVAEPDYADGMKVILDPTVAKGGVPNRTNALFLRSRAKPSPTPGSKAPRPGGQ